MLKLATMIAITTCLATAALAQQAAAPNSLKVMFDSGSATVRASEEKTLDQAARLYRDGSPIVMIIAGSADAVGNADANLLLSEKRAYTVLRALVARGIPVERFQIVAKGETEPTVPTPSGQPEPANRYAEISWR